MLISKTSKEIQLEKRSLFKEVIIENIQIFAWGKDGTFNHSSHPHTKINSNILMHQRLKFTRQNFGVFFLGDNLCDTRLYLNHCISLITKL